MTNVIRSAAAVALIAMGAVSAQAQVQSAEAGFAPEITQAQSTLSAQQVRGAYVNARQSGNLQLGNGDSYKPVSSIQSPSQASRSEVRAEAVAANQHGDILKGVGSVQ